MTRFDAWHASFRPGAFREVRQMVKAVLDADLEPRNKGMHGYTCSELIRAGGQTHGVVAWGGSTERPFIQVNGELSQPWADAIQGIASEDTEEQPFASLTRADVCFDWQDDRDVVDLAPGLRAAVSAADKAGRPVQWDMRGDWDTVEGRRRGCTLYMGAATSPARLRLYDKGAEQLGKFIDAPRNLRRLELQFRPKDKVERIAYVFLRPSEFWGLTRAVRLAADHFGVRLDESPARHYKGPSDMDKLQTLASVQYGSAIVEMVRSLLGPGAAATLDSEVSRRRESHKALLRLRA